MYHNIHHTYESRSTYTHTHTYIYISNHYCSHVQCSKQGICTRVGDVKPLLEVACFTCDSCGSELYQVYRKRHLIPLISFLGLKLSVVKGNFWRHFQSDCQVSIYALPEWYKLCLFQSSFGFLILFCSQAFHFQESSFLKLELQSL